MRVGVSIVKCSGVLDEVGSVRYDSLQCRGLQDEESQRSI